MKQQTIEARQTRRNMGLGLLLLLFAASTSGCNVTYDPPSLINKLRIVAVRAEPPVLSAVPTTLTPLVLGVDPANALCHAWSLCLFALGKDGNYVCVDPDLETSLGTAPTAQVNIGQAFAMLVNLEATFVKLGITIPKQFGGQNATPSLSDAGGFEVFIRFKVAERGGADGGATCPTDALAWLQAPCTDRDRCLAGYKRLALATSPKFVHKNPVISGLQLDGVDWPEDVTPTVSCYRGDDQYGKPGVGAIAMEPQWTAQSRELIPAPAEATAVEPKRESLLFSWLSTAGNWDKQRSYDAVPENAFLPPNYGGKTSQLIRIWVVARDGRNGTTWTSRQIEVRSTAATSGNPLCRVKADLPGCPAP